MERDLKSFLIPVIVIVTIAIVGVTIAVLWGADMTAKKSDGTSAPTEIPTPSATDKKAPDSKPTDTPSASPSESGAEAAPSAAPSEAAVSEVPSETAAAPSETVSVSQSEAPVATQAPTPTPASQPPLLTSCLSANGYSFSSISSSQLILVTASGNSADVYCYERDSAGIWTLKRDISYISGHVGKNGISSSKREGDGKTPAGLFSLPFAFGNSADPGTGLAYKSVSSDSVWVDDPQSAYYNTWQSDDSPSKDWSSAEKLSKYTEMYAYAAVIGYNTPSPVSGAGSAIFLHCGTSYTSGCICVPKDYMRNILVWLDDGAQILIVSK